MARVYFSLGSNMGDCLAHLEFGAQALEAEVGRISGRSSTYVTEPKDAPPQRDFHNLVIECETALGPEEVLDATQDIERRSGRARDGARGPRTLDIDVLLYDGRTLDTPRLQLPHPRMEQRAFVLVPLLEIAPDLVLPSGNSVRALVADPAVASQRVKKVGDAEL
jgi:2-amino-4-hydroxy-6-hydroxymethyldihydropteridine diphosphokinase